MRHSQMRCALRQEHEAHKSLLEQAQTVEIADLLAYYFLPDSATVPDRGGRRSAQQR